MSSHRSGPGDEQAPVCDLSHLASGRIPNSGVLFCTICRTWPLPPASNHAPCPADNPDPPVSYPPYPTAEEIASYHQAVNPFVPIDSGLHWVLASFMAPCQPEEPGNWPPYRSIKYFFARWRRTAAPQPTRRRNNTLRKVWLLLKPSSPELPIQSPAHPGPQIKDRAPTHPPAHPSLPSGSYVAPPRPTVPPGWEAYLDADQRWYYVNEFTGISQWELPRDTPNLNTSSAAANGLPEGEEHSEDAEPKDTDKDEV